MTSTLRNLMLAASAAALLAGTAQASDRTLRVAWDNEIDNLDQYFNTNREGIIFARHVWDALIYRNPETFEYEPLLATSWEWIDDTTMELELRQGVVFHNGDPFSADDVVYTINFVVDPDNGVLASGNVGWIESAEKIDDYTVRLHLHRPFPAAFEYLSEAIPIYPAGYYSEVGPAGMDAQPIGTGPYRVDFVDPQREYHLVRNDDYFEDSPKGMPAIERVEIRTITDKSTQIAELLSGGIDWMWRVPSDQADRLAQRPGFEVMFGEAMRIGYIGFDAAGRSGHEAIQDVNVRRAIAHAIDRDAIVDNLVRGDASVIHTPCNPVQFGCNEDAAVVYEFDPDRARELLEEAGYGDGFSLDLYAFRDRSWTEAVIGYLADVGIDASMQFMQYFALRDLNHQGSTPAFHMDWGSYSIADVSAIISHFFADTPDDFARDEEIHAWLEIADNSIDEDERRQYYDKVIERITDQVYWLPMHTFIISYAFVEDLEMIPFPDEVARYYTYSWRE
ncbi:MAG: ABC transporter substrate-binding protein [Alkalilacustris sp.]